jgi:hypothetical protein
MPIRRSDLFPNTSIRAAYSPRELMVYVDAPLNPEDTDKRFEKEWFAAHHPVLIHEFQHAVDHVSTVVGRALLSNLAGAHLGLERKRQGDASHLWRMAALRDAERRFDRGSYHHEYDQEYRWSGSQLPRWEWDASVGLAFDHAGRSNPSEPIYFLRFSDIDQRRQVSRQPITAAALFETRAMFVELEHRAAVLLREARDDRERQIAWAHEQASVFYAPSLTLYSAPGHLAASSVETVDWLTSLKLAAHVAGVVLNLAPELQLDIRIPAALRDPESLERLEQLVRLRDPGFLYVVLMAAAPPYEGDDDAWLTAALEAANFPTLTEIYDAALRHLASPGAPRDTDFDKIYFEACAAGHTNAARLRNTRGLLNLRIMSRYGTTEGPFALPNFDAGGFFNSPRYGTILHDQRQLEAYAYAQQLDREMAEFLAGCR